MNLKKIKNYKSIAFMELFNEKISAFSERWLQILVESVPSLEKRKEKFINEEYSISALKNF
jgi:hypothetical protein